MRAASELTQAPFGMNATFTMQDFERAGCARFSTGAANSEHDGDDFDYVGEGGISFSRADTAQREVVGQKLQF